MVFKKHSYYVHTSISEFYFNKKSKKKIKLGINLTPDELIITNIFKNSLADNSNLKIDDKILKINEVLISSLQDLDKQLKTIDKNKDFIVSVERNNQIIKIKVKVNKKIF